MDKTFDWSIGGREQCDHEIKLQEIAQQTATTLSFGAQILCISYYLKTMRK